MRMQEQEAVLKDLEQRFSEVNDENTLHFIYREADLQEGLAEGRFEQGVITALNKGLLYADRTVILTKPLTINRFFGANMFGNAMDGSDDFDRLAEGPDIVRAVVALSKSPGLKSQFRRRFSFLPEKLIVEQSEGIDEYTRYECRSSSWVALDFLSQYKNEFGINVSFRDPRVKAHMFETLGHGVTDVSVLNVWLPQISCLPLHVMLRLRRDEHDSFERMHFALKRLVKDSNSLIGEVTLKEIFQRVDYELRTFENQLRRIKKSRSLKAYESLLGFAIMGLCMAVPSETAKLISTFLGTYQAKELIGSLFHTREQMNDLKASDFYVPWLCGNTATKYVAT
jgi:hypothetical protein